MEHLTNFLTQQDMIGLVGTNDWENQLITSINKEKPHSTLMFFNSAQNACKLNKVVYLVLYAERISKLI